MIIRILANVYHQRVKMIKINQKQLELLPGLVVVSDTRGKVRMELKELESVKKITALHAEMNLVQEMLLHQILALQVRSTKVCRRKLSMFLEVQEGKNLMLQKTISLNVKVNQNQKLMTNQSVKIETTSLSGMPGQNVTTDQNGILSDLIVVVEIIVMTVQVQEISVGGLKETLDQIEDTVTAGMITILTEVTDMVEVTATTMMMMIMSGQVVAGTVETGVDMAEEGIVEVITEKTGVVEDAPEVEVVEETDC